MLGFDVYLKKMMIEKMIDNISELEVQKGLEKQKKKNEK